MANSLFELTILGSSSAMPTSEKYPTAQILRIAERFFLIDCGEGTQHQLRVNRINLSRINHIFISHLHGDHFFGLIGLLSTIQLLGRKHDLHIYADSRLKSYLDFQFSFLEMEPLAFKIVFHPLNFKRPDKLYSDKNIQISSFPLNHRIPCCGFLFKENTKQPNIRKDKIERYQIPIREMKNIKEGKDFTTPSGQKIPNRELVIPPSRPRSYAFCSDTAYFPSVVDSIKNVDLLYHEATFATQEEDVAIKTFHSTGQHAGKIATEAKVKKLLIGHFSSRYKNPNQILAETKAIFTNVTIAEENKKWLI